MKTARDKFNFRHLAEGNSNKLYGLNQNQRIKMAQDYLINQLPFPSAYRSEHEQEISIREQTLQKFYRSSERKQQLLSEEKRQFTQNMYYNQMTYRN